MAKNEVEEFYDEFDDDLDILICEELGFTTKKHKYSESFYEHWKKRIMELAMQERNRGYKDCEEEYKKKLKELREFIKSETKNQYSSQPTRVCAYGYLKKLNELFGEEAHVRALERSEKDGKGN